MSTSNSRREGRATLNFAGPTFGRWDSTHPKAVKARPSSDDVADSWSCHSLANPRSRQPSARFTMAATALAAASIKANCRKVQLLSPTRAGRADRSGLSGCLHRPELRVRIALLPRDMSNLSATTLNRGGQRTHHRVAPYDAQAALLFLETAVLNLAAGRRRREAPAWI